MAALYFPDVFFLQSPEDLSVTHIMKLPSMEFISWAACAQLFYPICRHQGGSSFQWVPVPTIMNFVPAFEWKLLLLPLPLLDQVYGRHLAQCPPCWTVLWSLPIMSWLSHYLFPAKLCVFLPAHCTVWNPCFLPSQPGFPQKPTSIHCCTPAMWGIPLWFCKSLSDATKHWHVFTSFSRDLFPFLVSFIM